MIKSIKISEHDFSTQVEDLLQRFGWRWMHMKPAMFKDGAWSSRMNEEGKGFPDYCVVSDHRYRKDNRLIFIELKSEKGKTTPAQEAWLEDLKECIKHVSALPIELGKRQRVVIGSLIPTLEVYLFRPSDIERITELLR